MNEIEHLKELKRTVELMADLPDTLKLLDPELQTTGRATSMNIIGEQRASVGSSVPSGTSRQHTKVGITNDLVSGRKPVNGLRHPPEDGTTGWYIWAGEVPCPEDLSLWVPLHVSHLSEWRPEILRYLGPPPGWRFLIATAAEDVWEDSSLLRV